jgi:hypothetical protein
MRVQARQRNRIKLLLQDRKIHPGRVVSVRRKGGGSNNSFATAITTSVEGCNCSGQGGSLCTSSSVSLTFHLFAS